ncbi:hypothetical protein D3C72_2518870 [compost metagenome]
MLLENSIRSNGFGSRGTTMDEPGGIAVTVWFQEERDSGCALPSGRTRKMRASSALRLAPPASRR